jgi:hypothetical protein
MLAALLGMSRVADAQPTDLPCPGARTGMVAAAHPVVGSNSESSRDVV